MNDVMVHVDVGGVMLMDLWAHNLLEGQTMETAEEL